MSATHVTQRPMDLAGFDKALAGVGWRRRGTEATGGLARITGIETVRLGTGVHITFETRTGENVADLDEVIEAVGSLCEDDEGFGPLVGWPEVEDDED